MKYFRGCVVQASFSMCIIGTLLSLSIILALEQANLSLLAIRFLLQDYQPTSVKHHQPVFSQVTIVTPTLPEPILQATPLISLIPTPLPNPIYRPTSTSTLEQYLPDPSKDILPTPTVPVTLLQRKAQETATTGVDSATRLVIPGLSLDAPIQRSPIVGNTWDVSQLEQTIGHLARTASPGNRDNVVLAAHVTLAPDGRPGPFSQLNRLKSGDLVTVYQNEQPFTYQIHHLTIVKATDVSVTYPSTEARLTLITCTNYNHQEQRYEDRLVAVGYLVKP